MAKFLGKSSALLLKTLDLFLLPLAGLVVFAVRLLRPLVIIRFGPVFTKRIGHFASTIEHYLCERDLGIDKQGTFDIFYYRREPISNYQLKKMWERILHLSPLPRLTHLADRINRYLPGYKAHAIPIEFGKVRDNNGVFMRVGAHLTFTAQEEQYGRQQLENLGITNATAFVCFMARDTAYLESVYPSYNWQHHEHRNVNIHNLVPAAEELVRRRYVVFRMGAVVKKPLKTANPKIIDYATKYRSDFLDIYLSAKCQFFISNGTGIDEIPKIFRRPVVYVNFVPLELFHSSGVVSLFIPRKLWLRKERRLLTFPEILDSGIGRYGSAKSYMYEKIGIDFIENTPKEITDLVVEMDERFKGTWKTTPEDEELQSRFRSLLQTSKYHKKIVTRIGAEFLRQNQALLV